MGLTKTCLKCEGEFPLETFHKNGRQGRRPWCRDCENERSRQYRFKPEYKEYMRNYHLNRKYGMSSEDHDALYLLQAGCCAICEKAFSQLELAVDHDHETGIVRGLLCHNCNRGLGMFFDSIDSINSAADYLSKFNNLVASGGEYNRID